MEVSLHLTGKSSLASVDVLKNLANAPTQVLIQLCHCSFSGSSEPFLRVATCVYVPVFLCADGSKVYLDSQFPREEIFRGPIFLRESFRGGQFARGNFLEGLLSSTVSKCSLVLARLNN